MKPVLLVFVLAAVSQATSWRSDLTQARNLQNSGQGGKAENLYEQVMADAKGLPPAELNALALELFYAGRYREAESIYHQALEGWTSLGAAGARDHIVTAANLGTLLRAEGRYKDAETVLLDCLRQAETIGGKDSLEWARTASGLAALYLVWGDFARAENFALQAKSTFEQRSDAGESERINNTSILGSVYVEEGRYDDAEPLLRAALAAGGPRLATRTYNELAVVALRQHRLAEAESLALKAVESDGVNSHTPLSAAIRNNLADICLLQERFVEAEQHYREAIAIWEGAMGTQFPDTGKAYMNLASFYHLRGRETGAEELYRHALGILEGAFGKRHLLVLVASNELADVLRAEGRYTESERLGQASLEGLKEKLPADDPRLLRALANQARLLASTRRPKEAAALRDRIEQLSRGFRTEN
jgi:tetratricopeptide (TPR) repeat protein